MKPSLLSMFRARTVVASTLVSLGSSAAAQTTPAPPPATDLPVPASNEMKEQEAADAPITEFDFRSAVISETGLTSDEAAQRARARAPQVASAEAVAQAAYWDSRVVWSGFLPQLNGSLQYKRITFIENRPFSLDPANIDRPLSETTLETLAVLADVFGTEDASSFTLPKNNYLVAANARWPVLDVLLRVWPQYEASKNIIQARKFQIESTAHGVELNAREAFYAYVLALANRAVFTQSVKQAQAQRDQIQLFVDAGTAAPVDLMSAVSRYEAARSALARAEGVVATSRSRLATLMGVPDSEITTIREAVADLPPAPTASSEELVKRGLNERAELKALRELVDAGNLQRRAERGGAMPQLSVEGNILEARPNPRYIPPNRDKFRTSWEVGATLSWSPNTSLVGYQRSQRANAEIARARADVIAMEDAIRTEVVQAYEDYKAADAAALASQAQLKAAEEAYRVRLAMYRVGAGVVFDLLQEDLRVTEARLALANAAINARVAMARLKRAAVLD